jgi:thiol:disulfide interchange protein
MFRRTGVLASCLIAVVGVVVIGAPAVRARRPPEPPAAEVVASAVARAAAEDKTVLIEFGASWCTWCRAFEAFVKAPDTGPIVAAHYVVVNLTVHERDDKIPLENPGGNALMDSWGGAASGLPFYVFVNRSGKKVADSNAMPNGANIGFQQSPRKSRRS